MDALEFLKKPPKTAHRMYALVGDEAFLVKRCRDLAVKIAAGDADPEYAVATYSGEKLDFRDLRDELCTVPFLAPVRVVIVETADPFVTAHREALEKYAAAPSKVGVLILEVKTFPETTKLAKALTDGAKLQCKAPAAYRLVDWAAAWGKSEYGKAVPKDAAELLVELVGPAMGLLDSELAKLATAVGAKSSISAEDVDKYVGRSRAANVFHILDAIGDGKPAAALTILAQLFEEGEDPLAVVGPLTAQLRKLAAVGRLLNAGRSLGPAMDDAGVPKWPQARQSCEKQLKHLGRRRLDKLTDWLVEINWGLKGGNPLPPKVQVERLVVRLARPRE